MSANSFIVTRGGAVVGYSVWPWDDVYIPVIGCFVGGALLATADCGRTLSALQPPPFTPRLRSRVKRKVMRMLGLAPPQWPTVDTIELQGPDAAVWFRLELPAAVVERLRADDPGVRIERLEDSTIVLREGAGPVATAQAPVAVEALLDEPDGVGDERLDGFAAFLAAPAQHQYEVAFVEYLRRMPEGGARDAHLHALQRGDITVFDLRRSILESEEFRGRRVGYGARLGASLTSPLWRRLADLPSPLGHAAEFVEAGRS